MSVCRPLGVFHAKCSNCGNLLMAKAITGTFSAQLPLSPTVSTASTLQKPHTTREYKFHHSAHMAPKWALSQIVCLPCISCGLLCCFLGQNQLAVYQIFLEPLQSLTLAQLDRTSVYSCHFSFFSRDSSPKGYACRPVSSSMFFFLGLHWCSFV